MFRQKKRSLRKGNWTTRPRVTQLVPKRKTLCFLLLKTASRKMPPKATLAPRLWQRVSSMTSQTRVPGTRAARSLDQEDAADLVPVPGGLAEEAEGRGVAVVGGASGGLPDAADGAASQADDPGGDHQAEGGEDLGAEAGGEGV